jgi:DNA-directed RNA polymerase subunit RPC12/RpoP
MEGHPAILCPRCGGRVLLRDGLGSAGAKVFTCAACGHEFTGWDADATDDRGD